jgi:hypothetical protein
MTKLIRHLVKYPGEVAEFIISSHRQPHIKIAARDAVSCIDQLLQRRDN